MESIVQKNKVCWCCSTPFNLHKHHIFYGTSNRKQSDKYGLTVWLCARHHNMSNAGVHFDKNLDNVLKKVAQKEFENKYDHQTFMEVFGKNYLD